MAADAWLLCDERTRCAYSYQYYQRVYRPLAPQLLDGAVTVSYSELIDNPISPVRQLAEQLKLRYGGLTERVIRSIRRRWLRSLETAELQGLH